jgi:hypothetical protein
MANGTCGGACPDTNDTLDGKDNIGFCFFFRIGKFRAYTAVLVFVLGGSREGDVFERRNDGGTCGGTSSPLLVSYVCIYDAHRAMLLPRSQAGGEESYLVESGMKIDYRSLLSPPTFFDTTGGSQITLIEDSIAS